jgi:hypothetical protein
VNGSLKTALIFETPASIHPWIRLESTAR